MYINGRWLIEPEVKAYIHKLEELNAEIRAEADRVLRENTVLREKQESADRQIAEYKRLLKAAVEDMKDVVSSDSGCRCCKGEQAASCAYIKCWTWRYADEALALIGEDGDTND